MWQSKYTFKIYIFDFTFSTTESAMKIKLKFLCPQNMKPYLKAYEVKGAKDTFYKYSLVTYQ